MKDYPSVRCTRQISPPGGSNCQSGRSSHLACPPTGKTSILGIVLRGLLLAWLALVGPVGCTCGRRTPSAEKAPRDARIVPRSDVIPLMPATRDPGPARKESAAELTAAQDAARTFTQKLLKGGLNRREVTALADIRGYRLYKRRFFGRAHAWFSAAVATDPRFELSLYNAARTAALLGKADEARTHLRRLAALNTPLARTRLTLARTDPDLRNLRDSLNIDAGRPVKTR